MKSFFMNLCDIQPSQLYISKEKLKEVDEYLDSIDIDDIYPIPIKKIGNNIFFTDGHTRAFALYRREVNKIKVCWDEDDLSWVEYIICLDWCNKEGIKSIADLKNRIVDEEAYKKLWLNRCYEMQCKVKKDISYYLKIKPITDIELKSKICNEVLRSLPDWFGIEEAIVEYVQDVKSQYFLSAFICDVPIGFISVKDHNKYTSEIYVLGILKEFHRMGIGKQLVSNIEEHMVKSNKKFLTVKTLSDSHPDEYYKRTRQFYKAMGFYPIEEFKTLWGESNPCLLMLKPLFNGDK